MVAAHVGQALGRERKGGKGRAGHQRHRCLDEFLRLPDSLAQDARQRLIRIRLRVQRLGQRFRFRPFPASRLGDAARIENAIREGFRGSDRIAHGRKASEPAQVVEVRGADRPIRPERWDGDARIDRSCGSARMGEARVARSALVVICAHDDLRLWIVVPDRAGDRGQVTGVEGNGDGIPGCCVNAGARGVALGDTNYFAGAADQEVLAGDSPALQESLRAAGADKLQAVQFARSVVDRHDQRPLEHAQPVRDHPLACQVGMFLVRRPRGVPDACGDLTGGGMAPDRFFRPSGASCLCPGAQRIELRRRQRAPDVEAPGFPALAVAPVFQSTGRNAIQVEQVSRIALAILARDIAAVKAAVGDDALGRNDVARGERRPKAVNDLGRGRTGARRALLTVAVEPVAMPSRHYADRRPPARAIFTRAAIHSLTSDSSQPTARGPSGTGFGKTPFLMYW